LFDRLDISHGSNWRKTVRAQLTAADVVLALIGPQWLDELRCRFVEPADDVCRFELAMVRARGRRVIPLRLEGDTGPAGRDLPAAKAPLAGRQATVRSRQRFQADVEVVPIRDDTQVERVGSHIAEVDRGPRDVAEPLLRLDCQIIEIRCDRSSNPNDRAAQVGTARIDICTKTFRESLDDLPPWLRVRNKGFAECVGVFWACCPATFAALKRANPAKAGDAKSTV
jgi:hypothetical protein